MSDASLISGNRIMEQYLYSLILDLELIRKCTRHRVILKLQTKFKADKKWPIYNTYFILFLPFS